MNTSNASLLGTINNDFDEISKIAALRAVVHSSMAKLIGAIRQGIRDRKRLERDTNNDQTSLDQRNEQDEDERAKADIAKAMGFLTVDDPESQAASLHAVYHQAYTSLMQLLKHKTEDAMNSQIVNRFDEPMAIEQMLTFMIERTQPLDKHFVEELAKLAGCSVEAITQMHELTQRQEREQLTLMRPEIITTFKGFAEYDDRDVDREIDPIIHYQFGVKVVEGLLKAKVQVMKRAVQRRTLLDLGNLPLLDDGIKRTVAWVEQFEHHHKVELYDAIEQGINIRSVEDIDGFRTWRAQQKLATQKAAA